MSFFEDNLGSNDMPKAKKGKKDNGSVSFSLLTDAERQILCSLKKEHPSTIEVEFKPNPNGSSCVVSSSDANKLEWVKFLIKRHRDSVGRLNVVLLGEDSSMWYDDPSKDIYDLAKTFFGTL